MIAISPYWALGGGFAIGLAAALLLLLSGRIAGVSGMVAAATRIAEQGPPWPQALAFTLGLPIGAWAIATFVRVPHVAVTSSISLLLAGGFLVGVGTRLGSGCTSGHGVCGLARLSPRSIAATATFMTSGAVTVFVMRHVIGG